ncbi:putative uncharacterized protein [Parachlamydia acanthamoebae UV-7]|uniref:Uncharacterized protein n=2 Tax=Parachlamydia acanthamoebae TaxID=83552 RepID=F8L2J9_PARAV|nr:hypothetical protein [Parachlamydia acanthamoebae]KIA76805.1 hypothetical protein DB43_HJ00160 [Parachlamydia acanthamoebae]CCB87520.1 putative uncharacterized protein [Parachlamydia acanthamoebae UV-7]
MVQPDRFPINPFHSHQIEMNLNLSSPKEIQKFTAKQGELGIKQLANRIFHFAKYRNWISNKAILNSVKNYTEFAKKFPENQEMTNKVHALAQLFKGTKLESQVNELIKENLTLPDAEHILESLTETVTQLSTYLKDGELSGLAPELNEVKKDILTTLQVDKKFYKKLARLRKQFPIHSPEATTLKLLIQTAQLQTKLERLGLDPHLASEDPQAVQFLFASRMIYNIVGFQNTSTNGKESHAIRQDENQRVMIKKQGAWVLVSEIMQDIESDAYSHLAGVVEKRKEGLDENQGRQRWNYFSPDGLVPVDRYTHPELYPVEQLSKEEMGELLAHAQLFAPEGEPFPADPNKTCVVQIYTNPRDLTKHDDNFFLAKLSASIPMHAGIRVINADGAVYSTGLSGLPEEQPFKEGRNILATVNSAPAILDFEEFRPHEGRIVTSIPVTPEVFEEIMSTLNDYRMRTVRFNLTRQNCTYLANEILKKTGVTNLSNEMSLGKALAGTIPSPKNVKLIGKPLRAIDQKMENAMKKVKKNVPKPMMTVARVPRKVIWFLPNAASKLLILGLGGAKGTSKKTGEGNASLDNSEEMANFPHLFPSATEVFKDNSIHLYHSLPLVQWQLQQQSTVVHSYQGKPAMGVVPSRDDEELMAGEKRKAVFMKRYVENFR